MPKKSKNFSPKAVLPKPDMKNAITRQVNGVKYFKAASKHWYDMPTESVAGAIKEVVVQIDNDNRDITEKWAVYAAMYGSADNLGFNNSSSDAMTYDRSTNLPSYNVVASCVDTLSSKIAKDNPTPYFITSNATYDTKLKAEKQTQFVQGVFQESGFYDIINNQVFRDAALYGTGDIKWKVNTFTNKIECQWVFLDELKIDRIDGMKKEPRSKHFCCLLQKEMLEAEYPDQEDAINDLAAQHPDWFHSPDTVVEFVVVTESFHLKNRKKPGRHVICCEDLVLLDEEYDEDYFPDVMVNLYNKPMGIFGIGTGDILYNDQIEINKQLLMIQQCEELQAAPLIFVPTQAQVSPDVLLSNNISRMVPYNGQANPPTFISPESCSPQLYEWVKWRITSAYERMGISLTSAAGSKQPGVDSAIAMRTLVDIESGRWVQVSKNWEDFICRNAETVMKLGKKAYQKDSGYSVQYMDKKSKIIKEIPWSKINSPDDIYRIKCDTISSFSSSMSGRISTVLDFFSQGIFSQQRTLEMLGMDPDVDEEYRLQTSSLRLCEQRLSDMVEESKYYHPEPFMDQQLALRVSLMTYNQLLLDQCPEDRLQLVRQWIEELATNAGVQDPFVAALQQALNPQPAPNKLQPQAGVQPA